MNSLLTSTLARRPSLPRKIDPLDLPSPQPMPHWLQVLLVVTFVASLAQRLITGYDADTLRDDPSYRPQGNGGILYTLRGGTPSYTHENKRGDVVAKTDGSGTLTYQAQYEAFGKQTATTGSTLDRQKSNSKDTDPTGLVDEGFRYRDLETGMFISRDPAGFVDGPNLYTYVIQNPWTMFDPEGLATERDYQNDQQAEQQAENQALQNYYKSTPKEKRTQKDVDKITKPYDAQIAKDQQKIDSIENTAKDINEAAQRQVVDASKLDDNTPF